MVITILPPEAACYPLHTISGMVQDFSLYPPS